jgi:hypothetical protein
MDMIDSLQGFLTPFRIAVLVLCFLIFTFGMVTLYGKKSMMSYRGKKW